MSDGLLRTGSSESAANTPKRLERLENEVRSLRDSMENSIRVVGQQIQKMCDAIEKQAAPQASMQTEIRDAVRDGVAPIAEQLQRVSRTGAKLKREVLKSRSAYGAANLIGTHDPSSSREGQLLEP